MRGRVSALHSGTTGAWGQGYLSGREGASAHAIHSLGLPPAFQAPRASTLELQGKSFFHGVRFSVQTTSGSAA